MMTNRYDGKPMRIEDLRIEIRRISNVTLAGNFAKPEDRELWVKRLRQLNGELSALEQAVKPRRLTLGPNVRAERPGRAEKE